MAPFQILEQSKMGERGTMLQREIIKRRGEKEGAGDLFEKYMHTVIYLGISEDF